MNTKFVCACVRACVCMCDCLYYSAFSYCPFLQKQYDVVPSITATTIPAEPPILPGETHVYSGKQTRRHPPNFYGNDFHSLSQHADHACSYSGRVLHTLLHAKFSIC